MDVIKPVLAFPLVEKSYTYELLHHKNIYNFMARVNNLKTNAQYSNMIDCLESDKTYKLTTTFPHKGKYEVKAYANYAYGNNWVYLYTQEVEATIGYKWEEAAYQSEFFEQTGLKLVKPDRYHINCHENYKIVLKNGLGGINFTKENMKLWTFEVTLSSVTKNSQFQNMQNVFQTPTGYEIDVWFPYKDTYIVQLSAKILNASKIYRQNRIIEFEISSQGLQSPSRSVL